nr:protein trichome birefringence-like 24 [Ziziphus jujuba var. spinosa]
MKLNWKLWLPQKHRHLLVKFAVVILLMGFAFRLVFDRSTGISSRIETPFPEDLSRIETPFPNEAADSKPLVSEEAAETGEHISVREKCNLFSGDWVPNPSGPLYTNESCPLIESHQNCMKNGRPDKEYLYWRWNPRDCELPRLDPKRFLEMMRDKTWALIGDSISRNHVQSLLCMLSKVELAVQVYHDEEYKSRRWRFPSYNFTISVIWSPFLVKAAIFEDYNGVSTSEVELHLDKLDKKWTDLYQNLDYMIISTGKWFLKSSIYYENSKVLGCHYCPKRNLTELGFDFAYRKALRFVMNFIATSGHKGLIFFRTSTPDHFENGEWFSGGNCKRTSPVKEGEIQLKEINRILHDIELEEFGEAEEKASKNGVNLKLLDFTPLLLLRPDGHPGPYREYYPFSHDKNAKVQNDCLHWCLPGPIDTWNDVIMEMMLNG